MAPNNYVTKCIYHNCEHSREIRVTMEDESFIWRWIPMLCLDHYILLNYNLHSVTSAHLMGWAKHPYYSEITIVKQVTEILNGAGATITYDDETITDYIART